MESSSKDKKSLRLTRGEYWILETVVDVRVPIGFLALKEIGVMFNKPGHNLGMQDLHRTLLRLVHEDLIKLEEQTTPEHLLISRNSEEDIWSELTKYNAVQIGINKLPSAKYTYELTEKGGQYWEEFACPDWSSYCHCYSMPVEYKEESCNVLRERYISKAKVKKRLEHLLGLLRNEITNTKSKIRMVNEKWERMEPWEATYWKTLPTGHKLSFDLIRDDCSDSSRDKCCSDSNSNEVSFPNPEYYSLLLRDWYRWS